MEEVNDESIDLIFTDPPYFQYRAKDVKKLKNHKDVVTEFKFDDFETEKEYLNFIECILKDCFRVAKNGASGYLFCADDFVSYINRIIEKVGFQMRKVIHWHKTNPFPAISTRKMFANSIELLIHFSKGSPSRWNTKHVNEMHNYFNTKELIRNNILDDKNIIRSLIYKNINSESSDELFEFMYKISNEYKSKGKEVACNSLSNFIKEYNKKLRDNNTLTNLIERPICMGSERLQHETQKPLSVCTHFIEISSNKGDLILDPFMGSGTTAEAAIMCGRNYIGYEVNNKYYEIAYKRLNKDKNGNKLF